MQNRRALRARREGECEGKASKKVKLCTNANGNVGARHHLEKEEKINNRSSRRTPASPSTRNGRPEATHGCELLKNQQRKQGRHRRAGRHAEPKSQRIRRLAPPPPPPKPYPPPKPRWHPQPGAPQRRGDDALSPASITDAHKATPPPRSAPLGGTNRLGAAASAPIAPPSCASTAAAGTGVVVASHKPSSSPSHHSCG